MGIKIWNSKLTLILWAYIPKILSNLFLFVSFHDGSHSGGVRCNLHLVLRCIFLMTKEINIFHLLGVCTSLFEMCLFSRIQLIWNVPISWLDYDIFDVYFFFMVLRYELRALCLLDRCSTTWAMPLAFLLPYLGDRILHLVQGGQQSYFIVPPLCPAFLVEPGSCKLFWCNWLGTTNLSISDYWVA
jgi:hypothetical protein